MNASHQFLEFQFGYKMVMKISRILHWDLCTDIFCSAYSTLTAIKVVFFVVMDEYFLITTFSRCNNKLDRILHRLQPSVESASLIFLAADDHLTADINNNDFCQFDCVCKWTVMGAVEMLNTMYQ